TDLSPPRRKAYPRKKPKPRRSRWKRLVQRSSSSKLARPCIDSLIDDRIDGWWPVSHRPFSVAAPRGCSGFHSRRVRKTRSCKHFQASLSGEPLAQVATPGTADGFVIHGEKTYPQGLWPTAACDGRALSAGDPAGFLPGIPAGRRGQGRRS